MTDQPTAPPAAPTPPPAAPTAPAQADPNPAPATGAPDDDAAALGEAGKRALDRMKAERDEFRRKANENSDAAKRLKEIEDRDLSELQKAQRDRAELEQRLAATEQSATRNRVALSKGLPVEIAETLTGSTEEEMAAHADRLIAWRSSVLPTGPQPDPGQGSRPGAPAAEQDEAEYAKYAAALFPHTR